MPFVVDASVALAWCFADEAKPETQATLASLANDHAVTPSIWPAEVANVLLMAERKRRVSATEVDEHLLDLLALPIRVELPPDAVVLGVTLALARGHHLTVYDAIYLELAIRLKLPLASLDAELMAAARAEGVRLALKPRS